MAIWPEEVSNEGHVYAAFDRDSASWAGEEPIEERRRFPSLDAAEELAMEDDLRWLEAAARSGSHAAITSLMAEHHANEAMLDQIRSSDKWSLYQAESIKANLFATKTELLRAMGKTVNEKDLAKVEKYRKDQETVKEEAKDEERASEAHLRHHTILSGSVTLFQIGIAVGAISVLTKRKSFWLGSLGFGVVGVVLLLVGFVVG